MQDELELSWMRSRRGAKRSVPDPSLAVVVGVWHHTCPSPHDRSVILASHSNEPNLDDGSQRYGIQDRIRQQAICGRVSR